ncbi:unnamed protein product, partial [Medioppia subpectinata]
YFVDYKLNVTDSTTGATTVAALDNYKTNFLSYLGIASISPNVVLQALNLFGKTSHGSLSTRISMAFVLQAVIFVTTIGLAIADTSGWPVGFFWLTMVTAVVINAAVGVLQSCYSGAAAKLPPEYMNATLLGNNLSGVIVAVFMLVSIALSPSPHAIGIIYFSLALVMIVVCLVLQYKLNSNDFYVYHSKLDCKSGADSVANDNCPPESHGMSGDTTGDDVDQHMEGLVLYRYVFGKTWHQLLNIFITSFSTLCIFPALMADIRPLNHMISERYFVPTFCFLFFNVFVTCGNSLAQIIQRPGPRYLFVWCALRLLFIPFFLY